VFKVTKTPEKLLYEIWKSKDFAEQLKTADGQMIEIIDVGENNKDFAGPDFFNSRIKIGNITYQGDVEIDIYHSDWKSHGHYLDKKYNKVILHIILSKERYQPYVFTQEKRKVNSICLTEFINQSYQLALRDAIQSERQNRSFTMPCSELNNIVPPGEKLKLLTELGVLRFKQKEKRIFERLKEMAYLKEMNIREPVVRYDFGEEFYNKKFSSEEFNDPLLWQQLIYEMIFEALGYSNNKDNMLKLAKAVNLDFLIRFKDQTDFQEVIECALFNVSGIIPAKVTSSDEKSSEYLRNLVEKWAEYKNDYDGVYFNEEKWNFFKLRPQNFPTVRIAAGSIIIYRLLKHELLAKLIESITGELKEKNIVSLLRNNLIVKAKGYWQNHYVFDKKAKIEIKYFLGLSRADEIIINVILPTLAVYFDIFENKAASRRVKNLYLNYVQKSSNQIVNQVESSLQLSKLKLKSAHIQGMIELFRHYCVKEKCLECKIGDLVFNQQ
jgi:Protein of unknown function (DUF2851)